MSTPSTTDTAPRSKARRFTLVAFLSVFSMVALRGLSEFAMMSVHGPDAQIGIWYFLLIGKLLFWLAAGLLVALLAVAVVRSSGNSMIGLVLVGSWSAIIVWASVSYVRGSRALADASNPATPPARLAQLVDFDGIQAGYELDNRLASNPNTPPEAIRKLAGRDQLGTRMILARDPNTPPDILQQLGKINDKYIREALSSNPSYVPTP